ncbi:MAG: glycosyl hydrolase [Cyclobacteriaceae bacterium]|nr:glycosyl hydrolase [Cyclobacteriaceae bacterium]
MKKPFFILLFLCISMFVAGQKNKNDKSVKNIPDPGLFNGLKFRSIGPALTSGRISDIAVNPEDKNTWYVAVSSGGVWKTNNAGTTWSGIFDDQGSYSIGCISIDPGNPHTLWVGTGENNNQRSVGYGDGVYKSMDGGKSWEDMGLKESEHIGNILVHPENSDIVYVAAYGPLWSSGGDRGVFRSTDGGTTWERILFISENTGINEIHMDPRDPEVLYAAAHQRRRHVYTYISGGPESAVYKSTDGGKSWKKIIKGLPEVNLGRIGLDISPVNPDHLFAIVEAADNKGGFFRSVNRGQSWEKMSDYSTSGNYYQEIFCDPVDLETVYAMDTWFHFTTDGGKTFKMVGENQKHVDNHALWINPENTSHMIVGSDGGLYITYDHALTWDYIANLPVTQFYKVSADNDFPFYNVYGGTQDNFSMGGPSRTTNIAGIVNSDWYITNGGDGFESVADPENPEIVYAQSQYGWLVRYDKKSGEILDIKPMEGEGEEAYRWNWDAPLMISPHKSTRLYFAANKVFRSEDRGNSWEVISEDLTRQVDRNKLPVMGKVWGMDAVEKNKSTSIYGNIVSLDESPLLEGLLYAGTDDGLIHVSDNGGDSWRKISTITGIPDMTYVNYLLASQHEEGTVYTVFNNHKNGDFKPYIVKSTDKGVTWQSISGDLPLRGSVYSLAEDHIKPDLLFAGTEFGLFFTNDGGNRWTQLKSGLPVIAVRDIAIQKRENDLVLGTFGRGIYILDDYSSLRMINEDLLNQEAWVFPVRESWMFLESRPLGLRGKSFQGTSYYTAENPPAGATFTYYLKDEIKTRKEIRQDNEKELAEKGEDISYPPFGEMRMEDDEAAPRLIFMIRDGEGNLIRNLEEKPEKGIHRITWDFHYPPKTPISITPPTFDNPFSEADKGPLALPGEYTVTMAKLQDGMLTELVPALTFSTRFLNHTSLPAEDKEALFSFKEEVSEIQRIVSGISETLKELKEKLKYISVAMNRTSGLPAETIEDISEMDERLKDLDRELNGDYSLQNREFPVAPSITARISTIVSGLWASTSAPTGTQKNSLEVVRKELSTVYENIREIVEEDMVRLEADLEEAGAPWTPGRLPVWKK